jgi:hypothetical protein
MRDENYPWLMSSNDIQRHLREGDQQKNKTKQIFVCALGTQEDSLTDFLHVPHEMFSVSEHHCRGRKPISDAEAGNKSVISNHKVGGKGK